MTVRSAAFHHQFAPCANPIHTFGLPNIELPAAPGPPEGEAHGPGGPPGPVDNRSIDLSVNFHGPAGSDPDEVRRQAGIAQDRGLAKVAPIDPGHH
jgi:hypothetical protein